MNTPATHTATMQVRASLSELASVRAFVEQNAVDAGFPEATVFQISLAVDEACSNVIRHAYKENPGMKFSLLISRSANDFTISILDDAESFDPTNMPPPDMNKYFAEFRHGGLGVHIIKKVMDFVTYIPADEKHPHNELRLVKNLLYVS
ncbi:MAG: ATP-binding protein [Candidatus Kapabacteria bacterium]|nr:ATP-binding protein [Candidatus Kapabacteria bacterium]